MKEMKLLAMVSISAVVGSRSSKCHRQNVGWIECNEIQSRLRRDSTQPTKCKEI
ncbi:hypothetical protein D1AOALGA4SA_12952 [Olavius algarvensis Delta 1 endosymbiont]|nr:hypothetical protein D1AOALGA4SA_12952 [Olavius algarvensis Delta 1 endosymbiont]